MVRNCSICGDLFDAKTYNAKYCSEACRLIGHAERNRAYYNDGTGQKLKATQWQEKIESRETSTEQAYADLAFAVVEHAFREGDYFWLTEFGIEFLAYSGNPLNQRKFDGLLEEMNGQKTKT